MPLVVRSDPFNAGTHLPQTSWPLFIEPPVG